MSPATGPIIAHGGRIAQAPTSPPAIVGAKIAAPAYRPKPAEKNSVKPPAKPLETAALGLYAKSVVTSPEEKHRLAARKRLYSLLKSAAFLISSELKKDHSIAKCRWTKIAPKVGLNLRATEHGNRAGFSGLATCSNVWGCAVCAARISRTRQRELNHALAWAKAEGLKPVMLTLTARHGRKDEVPHLLTGIKNAKRGLRQRKIWRDLPIVGSVTATEITHGNANGWHPHFHEIILVDAPTEAAAIAHVETLRAAWLSCLKHQGLSGSGAAFQVQGAAAAGVYVGKWGAAEELTLTGAKTAKGKGRTPNDLLELYKAGNKHAGRLWLDYFRAFSGRRQLVWSPGLKARAGINETSDAEAAEAEDDAPPVTLAEYDNARWRAVRSRRVALLEAAERGGAEAVRRAETGLTDAEIDEIDDCGGTVLDDDDTTPHPLGASRKHPKNPPPNDLSSKPKETEP